MDILVTSIIMVIVMSVEYLLCTKLKSAVWGGIIPLTLFVGSIFVFTSGIIPFNKEYIFYFSTINILFFCYWENGRNRYKKIKQDETEKMKAKDL